MNPAHLSGRLAGLFPLGTVAAELRGPGNPGLLLPAEAAHLRRASLERAQEFAAGRLCARRALAEFGIADVPVTVADDRRPLWPDVMVGSITHTAGFCAAVVARRVRVAALGLDSEVIGDVNAEIWPRICVPAETAWVRSLPASAQAAAVTLIFCAKEAFYKCQYSMVRERLNFADATVEAEGWDPCGGAGGRFRVDATRSIAIARHTHLPMFGQYLIHDRFLSAGMALDAANGSAADSVDAGGSAWPASQ